MLLLVEFLFILILSMILFMIYRKERVSSKNNSCLASVEEFWAGKERRKHVRFQKSFDVVYSLEKHSHLKNNCRMMDISEGGMKILIDQKLEKGAVMDLKVSLGDGSSQPAEVEGEIMWSEESKDPGPSGKRMFYSGVKFLAIKEGHGKRLADYLRGLPSSPSAYPVKA
jgi:hypothetical protein